jgi:hypothetical protein
MRGLVFGLLFAAAFWAVIAAIVANSGGMWCFASAVVAVTLIVCLLHLRHEDMGDD